MVKTSKNIDFLKRYDIILLKYRLEYKDEKITQEKLAELINVSVSLISSLESNKTKKGISINNLYKISLVLNVPIDKFFEEDNERESK